MLDYILFIKICKENVANILVPTLKYEDFLLFSVHVITTQTGFFLGWFD